MTTHSSPQRSSKPRQPSEFEQAVIIAKLRHRPANWRHRTVVAQEGFDWAE